MWIQFSYKNRAKTNITVFCNSAFSFTKLNRVILLPARVFREHNLVAGTNLLLKLYYIRGMEVSNKHHLHLWCLIFRPKTFAKIVKITFCDIFNFDLSAQPFIVILKWSWPFPFTVKSPRSSSKTSNTFRSNKLDRIE